MSQTLALTNFSSLNLVEDAQLNVDTPAASNSLSVNNAEDFTTEFLIIGVPGSDTCELLPNASVNSGTTITLTSPTVLAHDQYDLVQAIFGNQLRVYRAPDAGLGQQPPDSAFNYGTPYATVAIDPTNAATEYTDPSGSGSYWYKYTFFNSTTNAETDIASSTAVRGAFTVNYCSLDEIRREAGFRYAPYVSDDQIDEKRQAAQDEINGALDDFYETPIQPPIPDFLKNIAIRLSAGLLRQAQYSQISDPQVNGKTMYDAAQIDLEKLIMKERVLTNKQGQALDSPGGTGTIEGWPDASTRTAPSYQGGAPRVFRMADIQGQPYTVDPSGNPVGNLYYGRKY